MLSVLEKFLKNVGSVNEYDYGDFMRFANVYLNELKSELVSLRDPKINAKLEEMQRYIQFAPNWDVGLTRQKIVEDGQYLRDILKAHKQDWESDIGAINPDAKTKSSNASEAGSRIEL